MPTLNQMESGQSFFGPEPDSEDSIPPAAVKFFEAAESFNDSNGAAGPDGATEREVNLVLFAELSAMGVRSHMQCENADGTPRRDEIARAGIEADYHRYKRGLAPTVGGTALDKINIDPQIVALLYRENIYDCEGVIRAGSEHIRTLLGEQDGELVFGRASALLTKLHADVQVAKVSSRITELEAEVRHKEAENKSLKADMEALHNNLARRIDSLERSNEKKGQQTRSRQRSTAQKKAADTDPPNFLGLDPEPVAAP